MAKQERRRNKFDPPWLLSGRGAGQSRLQFAAEQTICAQDDPADAVFYIESGLVKMSTVSPSGKEAVVSLRGAGDFFGVRSLIGRHRRVTTATALTDCTVVRIATSAATRLLREEPNFAEIYTTYLTRQHARDQENLADLLINSAEKRLARVLLQLANSGPNGADRDRQDNAGAIRCHAAAAGLMPSLAAVGRGCYHRAIFNTATTANVRKIRKIQQAQGPPAARARRPHAGRDRGDAADDRENPRRL